MVTVGLVGAAASVLCMWAGVCAVARADQLDGGTSPFRGSPRMWLLSALTLSVSSVLVLIAAVVWQFM